MISVLRLLIQLIFVAVLLSYLLRLYEWRNLTREERGDTEERLAPSFTAAAAMVWEFLTTLLTLALTPLGWFDTDPDEPRETEDRPIIFVPGLTTNRGAFLLFRRYFLNQGYNALFSLNLGPRGGSLRHFMGLIEERVNDVLAQTGAEKVDLICFGMGGMAARLFIKEGGAAKVGRCITLGTAHQGTRMSALWPGRANRELMINRPLMGEFKAGQKEELELGPRYINIFSTFDNVVLPPTEGCLPGAENYRLDFLGHTALLYSRQVHRICLSAVRGESAEGHPNHYFAEFPDE